MPEAESLRPLLEFIMKDFNHRCATEAAFRVRFTGLHRRILARVNGQSWWFELRNCTVPEIHDGECADPHITLEADDPGVVKDVFSGRLGATVAIMKRLIHIEADMGDLLLLKKLVRDEQERIARFLDDYDASRGAAVEVAANGGSPVPARAPVAAPVAGKRKTLIFGAPDGPR